VETRRQRKSPARTWPDTGVSILNGMVGDYLDRRGNPLAIAMSLRHDGRVLPLDASSLASAHPDATRRLCVLVHGYCCNERVWEFPQTGDSGGDASYGAQLQRDCGLTPFYVRYNTGLPIAESGTHLAALLQGLAAAYPQPIEEITLIGHSMGGLVLRSACDPSRPAAQAWLGLVRRMIYLGTPHDGADLARFAHLTTRTLQTIPNRVTRLVGDILNLRSRGVKDLTHGRPSAGSGPLPWLASAQHHVLAGTLTKDPRHPVGRIFGDALVRVPPAEGIAPDGSAPPEVIVFPGIHHLGLAHDASVYRSLRDICTGGLQGERAWKKPRSTNFAASRT
jgi:triacylglycerol lipase